MLSYIRWRYNKERIGGGNIHKGFSPSQRFTFSTTFQRRKCLVGDINLNIQLMERSHEILLKEDTN